ncbi:MAG: PDZ domain-containing protein [Desulfuromonadaceae bacterium]|nr:PDZ domain-containing protein [Desulfuromonadaceae bacterium]
MIDRSQKLRFPCAALLLVLMVGCSVNEKFVYKPAAPVAESPKLPVKVAVLPFKDGTENFTKRGSELFDQENLMYNLAKAGIGSHVNALTPELWAKAFADELAASGSFQAVRFAYSPSELVDEEYFIEGTLEKAYLGGTWVKPNQFALSLRALRRADNRPVWEKGIARTWKNAPTMYDGCGMGLQCMVDRHHADYNQTMQSMFAEARTDLVKTIAPFAGNRGGEGERLPDPSTSETGKESIVGIGLHVRAGDSGLSVESVIEGTPASKEGVQAGDTIISIDESPTTAMSVVDAVGRLRGAKGTTVTLGVMRAGWRTQRNFTLTRDVIRGGTPAQPAPESVDETIESIIRGH